MKKLSILVLCNNRMAYPTLRALAEKGVLAGVAIPDTNTEVWSDCRQLLAQTNIPVELVKKESLSNQIQHLVQILSVTDIWILTFPWKIPGPIIDLLPNKILNFHFGMLPQMRGVDPVFECLRQSLPETALTVHVVNEHIDKGPIVASQKLAIHNTYTHGYLCTQFSMLAAQMSLQLIHHFQINDIPQHLPAQDDNKAVYYKRPGFKDVSIQWKNMKSTSVMALIRACNPWNKGAYTNYKGWLLRILDASAAGTSKEKKDPGTIWVTETNEVLVQCIDNELVKLNLIYTDEGYYTGKYLTTLGIKNNDNLTDLY